MVKSLGLSLGLGLSLVGATLYTRMWTREPPPFVLRLNTKSSKKVRSATLPIPIQTKHSPKLLPINSQQPKRASWLEYLQNTRAYASREPTRMAIRKRKHCQREITKSCCQTCAAR